MCFIFVNARSLWPYTLICAYVKLRVVVSSGHSCVRGEVGNWAFGG